MSEQPESEDLHKDLKRLVKADGLALDIDIRLRNLWRETTDVDEWDLKTVAAFIRAAYGQGYIDALKEDTQGQRAKLCTDHGYRTA
jgi:hypothetical protein